ncbi:MAG: HesA/MoeB/ThiF family protein [Halanaerobiales bacterium]
MHGGVYTVIIGVNGEVKMDFWRRQKPIFSREEEKKLRNMTVYIAGAGGLGTHQALELQRAGIKKIYLVDFDRVEASNLNRQVFYGRNDIGRYKVEAAGEFLQRFNLETEIVTINKKITLQSEIPDDVDVIYDALDNFDTRFILDELAEKAQLPFVHAGINSWYGQITTILPAETPRLRDIFGEGAEPEEEIPVFSPVVAIIASLQVVEGIKIYLDYDNNLANKLLLVDTNDYSLNKVNLN